MEAKGLGDGRGGGIKDWRRRDYGTAEVEGLVVQSSREFGP